MSHFERLLGEFVIEQKRSPRPAAEFLEGLSPISSGGYGMATTCVQVSTNHESLIIDAGTGIAKLGDHLMQGPAGREEAHVHLFLSHFHGDHLIGLPLFKPAFVRGNHLTIYSVQENAEQIVTDFLKRPWVENGIESWNCSLKFQSLLPRTPFTLGDMTLTPYRLDHPDPCWGLKVTNNGKTYSHCADTEANRIAPKSLGEDLPLYQNVDLMYFDAQYAMSDLADRLNWGHSAAQIGLELAFRENIKRVAFSHHDPASTNEDINKLIKQTQEYYHWKTEQAEFHQTKIAPVEWSFVYEGARIVV